LRALRKLKLVYVCVKGIKSTARTLQREHARLELHSCSKQLNKGKPTTTSVSPKGRATNHLMKTVLCHSSGKISLRQPATSKSRFSNHKRKNNPTRMWLIIRQINKHGLAKRDLKLAKRDNGGQPTMDWSSEGAGDEWGGLGEEGRGPGVKWLHIGDQQFLKEQWESKKKSEKLKEEFNLN